MERKSLIRELTYNLNRAKEEASKSVVRKDMRKGILFVPYYGVTGLNPDCISGEEFQQIMFLSQFLKCYPKVNDDNIDEVLNSKHFKFKFLRKLHSMIPDMVEKIRENGPKSVAEEYAHLVYTKKLEDLHRSI
ncbi:MAG: hypothetical protein E7374_01005 [Clostridiales bacterium]|nr:hypothetical protein [Clostridiales bacterium]